MSQHVPDWLYTCKKDTGGGLGVTCAGAAGVWERKEDSLFLVGRKGDSRSISTPFTLLGVRGISEGVD
jgi:hypothetical protein